jgi:multiple sugar transport system permease protein
MRWRRSIRPRRADPLGLVLLVPAGVVLLVLSVGPVAYAFYLGFTNVDLVGPTAQHFSFTPGTNLDSLWHDSLFWKALWLTGVFVAASAIAGVTIVGMALAVLMRRAARIVRLIVGAVVVAAWILAGGRPGGPAGQRADADHHPGQHLDHGRPGHAGAGRGTARGTR